jgi:hypothetical protein
MSDNQIYSGNIQGGNFTPTGAPIMLPVDNPYITKDEFLKFPFAAGLGITSASTSYSDGSLDWFILEASAEVNRICRRYFDTQTVDEQKTGFRAQPFNPQLTTVVLNNRPFQSINTIYIQVLQWFIQVITQGPQSYLQPFPRQGFYKIVPLLSTSGTGVGSPIPAAILDKVALGVLWTNYTFGYGTNMSKLQFANSDNGAYLAYQAPFGKRLMAPSQPTNVYKNGILQATSTYTITDYPNGIVTFNSALTSEDIVSMDFVSNESVPFDIKRAVAYLVADVIGQGGSNPLGADSLSIQTYSIRFSDGAGKLHQKAMDILQGYINRMPTII